MPTLLLIAAVATSLLSTLLLPGLLQAQSVGLPLPRLLTTSPMGGKAGTQVELTISGEHIDEADQLVFSDPRITAARKLNAEGKPEANRYLVTIPADCPPGLYESRVMTRLGISSSRAFAVGTLPELSVSKPNTSLATAMELPVNTVCNAAMSARAVDYYSFEARKGQRLLVDCATRASSRSTGGICGKPGANAISAASTRIATARACDDTAWSRMAVSPRAREKNFPS